LRAAWISCDPSVNEIRVRHRSGSGLHDREIGPGYPPKQKWQIGVVSSRINAKRSKRTERLQAAKGGSGFDRVVGSATGYGLHT
jgi:hypothetical protein